MTAPSLSICAAVSPAERVGVESAVRQAIDAVQKANGPLVAGTCSFVGDLETARWPQSGQIIVISLLSHLAASQEPWAEAKARLSNLCAELCANGNIVFLMTIFRHVDAIADRATLFEMRKKIRRLNWLAPELSRETGAYVCDVDRVLSDIGAQRLGTDYRLTGKVVEDLVGNLLARDLIAIALDGKIDALIQEQAVGMLEKCQPIMLPVDLKPANVIAVGLGRRKQLAMTVIETDQHGQIVWLLRQIMSRQIGVRDAVMKLTEAVRRRGAKESVAIVLASLSRVVNRRSGS